jgi:hypothetical protein
MSRLFLSSKLRMQTQGWNAPGYGLSASGSPLARQLRRVEPSPHASRVAAMGGGQCALTNDTCCPGGQSGEHSTGTAIEAPCSQFTGGCQ